MGKTGDLVYNNYYAPHLAGVAGFKNNPVMNEQMLVESIYFEKLVEMAASRFQWEGMPDTVDLRFLELELFRRSLAVFYFDADYDRFMALSATGAGQPNMYGNPTSYLVTGNTMLQKILTPKECVPIWGTFLRRPKTRLLALYAKKLANIDRTIDINIEQLRYPKVITTNENQRQSWVNIINQHQSGQPVIFGTEGLDLNQVQAFDTGVHPDVLPKLFQSRNSLWSQCMGLIGINNANQDKRERLVADEVSANDEQVAVARNTDLYMRQLACDQINKMFGLQVSVKYSEEPIDTTIPDMGGDF